jgi:hypothetical protein
MRDTFSHPSSSVGNYIACDYKHEAFGTMRRLWRLGRTISNNSGVILHRTSVSFKDEYATINDRRGCRVVFIEIEQETVSSVAKYHLGTSLPLDSATFQAFNMEY